MDIARKLKSFYPVISLSYRFDDYKLNKLDKIILSLEQLTKNCLRLLIDELDEIRLSLWTTHYEMSQTIENPTAVSKGYGKLTTKYHVSGYSWKERRSSRYRYLK